MSEELENTSIREVYAQRIAADLERNRAEQEEVGERIAALRARLERLKADERWLAGLRQGTEAVRATGSNRTESHGDTPDEGTEASLPAPRQEERSDETAAQSGTARSATTAKKAGARTTGDKSAGKTPARKGPTKKKTAAKKSTAKKTAAHRRGGPSLRELARECLEGRSEPRSAAEITRELQAVHPERPMSVQLVRNALEKLVATGAAERSKQGANVFYTPVERQAPSDAPQTGERQEADENVEQAPVPA